MFQGGAKYSTETVKCSTEVLNVRRTMSNVPFRCYIFHGEGQMFHGGAKYFTDNVKCSTEVLTIPHTMSNARGRAHVHTTVSRLVG